MFNLNTDSMLLNPELNPERKVSLPCNTCNGDCCGPIPLSNSFIKKMWKKYKLNNVIGSIKKVNVMLTKIPDMHLYYYKNNNKCVFKTDKGCSIYHDRPSICKVYGDTYLVRCPYENMDKQPTDNDERKRLVLIKEQKQEELIEEFGKKLFTIVRNSNRHLM